jgi:hypothetical protein
LPLGLGLFCFHQGAFLSYLFQAALIRRARGKRDEIFPTGFIVMTSTSYIKNFLTQAAN